MCQNKPIWYSCFLAAVTGFWYMFLVHCFQGENLPHKYICILLFSPFRRWMMYEMNSKNEVMKRFRDEGTELYRERERERRWRGVRNLGVPEIRLACVYVQSSWLEFQITESSNFKAQPDEIEIRYCRYRCRIDQQNSLVTYINNTHTYTHRYISRQTDRLIHSYKDSHLRVHRQAHN